MRLTSIAEVVPWGRSFDEYVAMFALSEADLASRILDCGGGPASFTADATRMGISVVAVDPVYAFTAEQIESRVREIYAVMVAGMEAERDRFVWDTAGSPEALGERRLEAMRRFSIDFVSPGAETRYVAASLPELPFADASFDLALSSHFLFLYAEQLSRDFHVAAVNEMLRVAAEVRLFPLLDMAGERSAHVGRVQSILEDAGHRVEVRRVDYEFQLGGNEMMVVRRGPVTLPQVAVTIRSS